MSATALTAQECYLLEHFTSVEYYRQLRDNWEAMVNYLDDLLERFTSELPDRYRKRALPDQPDVVWGQHVIPHFRDTLQKLYQGYIAFSNGDWSGWGGFSVKTDIRGQSEYSYRWMDEVEQGASDKYFDLLWAAGNIADNIYATYLSDWPKKFLSHEYESSPLDTWESPTKWPRYRLNPAVQVVSGEAVTQPGLYWPTAEDAAVQFLVPTQPHLPMTRVPRASVSVYPDDEDSQEYRREPTTWILVERVPGETVDDGLADLLTGVDIPQTNVAGGKPCPRSGWWFSLAEQSRQNHHFKEGDIFPVFEGSSYGDTYWQWSPDQSQANV